MASKIGIGSVAALVALLAFTSCGEEQRPPEAVDAGSSAGPDSGAPDAAEVADAGAQDAAAVTDVLTMTATINPSPPKTGQNTMTVFVKYSNGSVVANADVTVNPQMPSMGHGSSEVPVVEYKGGGEYKAYPVTFTMPGTWRVTVRAVKGSRSGELVFNWAIK
jgi:hypothetical protein